MVSDSDWEVTSVIVILPTNYFYHSFCQMREQIQIQKQIETQIQIHIQQIPNKNLMVENLGSFEKCCMHWFSTFSRPHFRNLLLHEYFASFDRDNLAIMGLKEAYPTS